MKRINLLKPLVVSGFLSGGRGQEVSYLSILPDMTPDNLSEDIGNGANYLREVRELMDKKESRVVIIKCQSQEEGLLGVSYLASYYNALDGADTDEIDCDENDVMQVHVRDVSGMSDEEFREDIDRSACPVITEDQMPVDDSEVWEDPDECEDDWEESESWDETPWKIPIISMGKLNADIDYNPNSPFFNGDRGFDRQTDPNRFVPYWMTLRRESICVTFDAQGGDIFGYCPFNEKVFTRFRNNKHIYVLIIDSKADFREKLRDDEEDGGGFFGGPFGPCSGTDWYEAALTRYVLDSSADIISLHHGEDKHESYYQTLLENWISHYGFTPVKGFPAAEITKKIVAMDNPAKSDLIDKVVSYVIRDFDKPGTLTEEDFNVLYKLRGLGFKRKADEKEHRSIHKMEKSLVGMEEVKDQIRDIVETFRFVKKRKAAGLQAGGYHNVHMMLGAPGTAKTTVAQLLGEIMAEERLLRSNQFISVNGAELKGMFVGHSAPKVKALFDQNDIIFIDEAYAVAAGGDRETDSFSQEAIAQLIVELENHGMDRLVIFAGYGGPKVSERDNRMLQFLNANPGIRSRINSTIFFDSYTADQMVEIFRGQARINQFKISRSADRYVYEFFEKRVREPDFGNGREARSLLENAMVETARRVSAIPEEELTKKNLELITTDDIRAAIEKMRSATSAQTGVSGGTKLGF